MYVLGLEGGIGDKRITSSLGSLAQRMEMHLVTTPHAKVVALGPAPFPKPLADLTLPHSIMGHGTPHFGGDPSLKTPLKPLWHSRHILLKLEGEREKLFYF